MMTNPSPCTPPKTRIYAIGDVHGRLDLLDQLLAQIAADAETALDVRRVLVMLGDYVDRGPESAGVLDRLSDVRDGQVLAGFEVHLLKGNHEDRMLAFLAGQSEREGATWFANGGSETLASYGLDLGTGQDMLRRQLMKVLPRAHKKILRGLQLCVVLGDYGFVHAGMRPGVTWQHQDPQDLLWIRDDFLNSDEDFGVFVVHGHAARDAPEVRANRVNIDTRAWASGTLTCLVAQGTQRRFLST